jgi:GntR family transcriptional regulator
MQGYSSGRPGARRHSAAFQELNKMPGERVTADERQPGSTSTYHPVIPLHYQIQRVLRAEIASGKLAVGERVPPEFNLMRRFEVSRTTIRRALRWLESDGLIVRQRRTGTFVAQTGNSEPASPGIRSLLLGYRADVRLLGARTIPVPGDIAPLLCLDKDREVREYRRLELVDGMPLAVVLNYVRGEIAARIDEKELGRVSMLEILRDRLRLKLGPLRQSLRADLPDEMIAGLLNSDVSQPVLVIRLVVHDDAGEAIQVCDAFYRGDAYHYEIETFLPESGRPDQKGIVDIRPGRRKGR